MGRINKKKIENINKIINNLDNIINDASAYICDYVEYDYNNIIREEIDRYYFDYSPRYYKRTKSLYNAYKIINDGEQIGVDFDSKYMHHNHRVDRKNEDYIFHWMFEKGYHGGSRPEGGRIVDGVHMYMLYRTPTPEAISLGLAIGKPYENWSKQPVYKTKPSPMEGINQKLDEYDKKKLRKRIRQGIETAFFKYDIEY